MATIQVNDDTILISAKTERQDEMRRHYAVSLQDISEVTFNLYGDGRASDYWWVRDARCVSDAHDAHNAVLIRMKRGTIRTFVLDIEDRDVVQKLAKAVG